MINSSSRVWDAGVFLLLGQDSDVHHFQTILASSAEETQAQSQEGTSNVPEGPLSNLLGDQSCGGHLPRDTGPANMTKEKLHLHCLGLAIIAYCLTENIIISNIKVLMFGTFPSDRA